jgi:hypothetical protein
MPCFTQVSIWDQQKPVSYTFVLKSNSHFPMYVKQTVPHNPPQTIYDSTYPFSNRFILFLFIFCANLDSALLVIRFRPGVLKLVFAMLDSAL